MNSIFDLIDALDPSEKTKLLKLSAVKNSTQSKKYQLLKEYIHFPNQEDKVYCRRLYSTESKSAFVQLKKRVKEDIYEMIPCLGSSLKINGEVQDRITCTSLLLQSQHLLSRGLEKAGSKTLEKSLKTAVEADLPDLILCVFDTARRFGVEGVIHSKDLPQLELIVKSHLQILVNRHLEQSTPISCQNVELGLVLRHLTTEQKQWEYLSMIRKALSNKDLDKAEDLQKESAELFEKNKTSEEINQELTLIQQQILIHTGKFKEVIQHYKSMDSSRFLSSENRLEHIQYQWLALYYLGRLEEAQALLKKSLSKFNPELNSKWKYWEACLHFRMNSFKSALKLIHDCQPQLKYSPNFYLGSKMLELMILFDQNDLDWLDYKIENLRKLISRWTGKINPRIEGGFKLFSKIQRKNVEDSAIQIIGNEEMTNLVQARGSYFWDPTDFELVRFDAWIEKRLV
ncbi:hypothetical protein Aoki45_23160 [Algoriphagus sp. oki45]|uniref:hypothetical protein n=1 Tax=Algoriphagus sp. oki45 TaxID=3067294 RepID=UPI0027EC737A|nr:hypothetical protein Aoki45_23160 [Algoriphagus sp. oki45]